MSLPSTPTLTDPDALLAPPGSPAGLRSVTVKLTCGPVDLVDIAGEDGVFWQHEGAGLAGRGVAATIQLPNGLNPSSARSAAAALGQIVSDDPLGQPGTGPIAVGSLPFDRHAPAHLVIPAAVVGRDRAGSQWLTLVTPREVSFQPDAGAAAELVDDLAGARAGSEGRVWSPDQFSLVSARSHEEWCELIALATRAIEGGEFRKVVLAREVTVEANRPFVLRDILRRLLVLHPACMVFALGGFLGASPELLVGRRGRRVRSHPLAGTISRSGDIDTDAALAAALLASKKDRREHGLVVDAVAQGLDPFCARLDVPEEPAIVALRNVAHLGTEVTGELLPGTPPSALELVAALHPTPAVGGTPAAAALAFMRRHEGLDRDRYAGPVGWMDQRGDGDWAVGIRSAEVDGVRARLFAGVGVVAGSDPDAELAETQLKLQALLAALVRP